MGCGFTADDGIRRPAFLPWLRRRLARLSLERNRSSDRKSRQNKMLERILIAKVYQLLRNSL